MTDDARCVSRLTIQVQTDRTGPVARKPAAGKIAQPIPEGVADLEAERPLRLRQLRKQGFGVDGLGQDRAADEQARAVAGGGELAAHLVPLQRPAVGRVERQRRQPGRRKSTSRRRPRPRRSRPVRIRAGAATDGACVSDSTGVRSTRNAAPAATTTNRATAPTRRRKMRACADNGPRAVTNTPRNVTTPSAAIAASTIGDRPLHRRIRQGVHARNRQISRCRPHAMMRPPCSRSPQPTGTTRTSANARASPPRC